MSDPTSSMTSPLAYGGYATGAVTIVVSWFQARRRGDIDESTLVMNKWKELVEQHQSDIKGIREEFAAYKATAMVEINDLRARLREAEKRIGELETENSGLKRTTAERIEKLEEENAGFKRAIIQNSQSTAQMLPASPAKDRLTRSDQEMVDKLDRIGHNSIPG